VHSNLFIGLRKDSRVSLYHLVHDLRHTDHLVLIVEYWHAKYTRRVITGLLINYLVESRILCANITSDIIRL